MHAAGVVLIDKASLRNPVGLFGVWEPPLPPSGIPPPLLTLNPIRVRT